jgi:hypothetical protein
VKQVLSLLAAFIFGAFIVYALMSMRRSERPDAEEWGIVVVHFVSGGPSLWGLFESKAECLKARTAYMGLYEIASGGGDDEAKKEPRAARMLILKSGEERIPVTFSCLPLSEIRGLVLDHNRQSN